MNPEDLPSKYYVLNLLLLGRCWTCGDACYMRGSLDLRYHDAVIGTFCEDCRRRRHQWRQAAMEQFRDAPVNALDGFAY